MYTSLLVAIACAILFHRAAAYEKMASWAWALASGALSAVVLLVFPRVLIMLLVQFGLFLAMWAYNVQRRTRQT